MPGDRFTLLLFLNFLFLLMFPHLCYGLGVRMLDGFLPNLLLRFHLSWPNFRLSFCVPL